MADFNLDGFEEQCMKCKYGGKNCPITSTLLIYYNNYETRSILNNLVNNKGECSMYKEFEYDFKI